MAIANSDGSIILSTKVDTSGINKGMSEMQGKATSLTKTFSKLGAAIASAFAIQKIIQFSNEAGQLATQTEASIQRLIDIYGSASDTVGEFIDQNARALGMSKASAASFASVYGNLFSVWADQETNARLTNKYLQMTAVVASKTGRTVEDVQERVRSGLLGNTEAIEDLGVFVNVKTIEMTDAFKRMADGKSWEQLDAYMQQQIRSMAILEQATAKYGDQVAETSATTKSRFRAAYEDFKQSWGEIVNRVLLPVLEVLTSIFDIFVKGLDVLTGNSSNVTDKIEENTGNISGNIDESNKNQEDFNESLKEAEKTSEKLLANFDDLYILTSGETNSPIIDDIKNNLVIPDDWGSANVGNATEGIDTELAKLASTVGEYLTALGVILLFMGSIAWGIGFIVAGVGLYGVTEAALSGEGFNKEKIISDISDISEQVGKLLLAIGAILVVLTGFNKYSLSALAFGALAYLIGKNGEEISVQKWDIGSVKSAISSALEITANLMILIGMIMVVMTGFNVKSLTILSAAAIMKITDQGGETVSQDTSAITKFKSDMDLMIAWAEGASLLIGLALCYGGYWDAGLKFLAGGAIGLITQDSGTKQSMTDVIFGFIEGVLETIVSALWWLVTAIRDFINWAITKIIIAPIAEILDLFDIFGVTWGDDLSKGWEDLTGYSPRWGGWGLPSFGEWIEPSWMNKVEEKIPYTATLDEDEPMEQMSANTAFSQNNSNKTEIVLEIDGREFGRAVVEQGQRESQRIGTRLVVV